MLVIIKQTKKLQWMDGGMMDERMNGKVEGLGKVED